MNHIKRWLMRILPVRAKTFATAREQQNKRFDEIDGKLARSSKALKDANSSLLDISSRVSGVEGKVAGMEANVSVDLARIQQTLVTLGLQLMRLEDEVAQLKQVETVSKIDSNSSAQKGARKSAVSFESVRIDEGFVEFDVCHGAVKDHVFFYLPDDVTPRPSEVAVAMAAMSGTKFDEIAFDLPIDSHVRDAIQKWTHASVYCSGSEEYPRSLPGGQGGIVLNFSGGLDSLAALHLLPEDTMLLSTNFMGSYQREYECFKCYSPRIVTTNLRAFGYNLNSPAFIGASSCLVKSSLGLQYNVFGDCFETYHLVMCPECLNIFDALGWEASGCMSGLTQVGTTMVANHYTPLELERSLRSLASYGSEKHYRKALLIELTRRSMSNRAGKIVLEPCVKPREFGTVFSSDLLTLYELKHVGYEQASVRSRGIPEDAMEIANDLRLDFLERLDTRKLGNLRDESDRLHFIRQAERAGVVPYETRDYEELKTVVDWLMKRRDDYVSANEDHIDEQRDNVRWKRAASYLAEELPPFAIPSGGYGKTEAVSAKVIGKDSEYNYVTVVQSLSAGFHRFSVDVQEISGCDRYSLAIVHNSHKKRVLCKTYDAYGGESLVVHVKEGGMKLLLYPNEPGKTQGCSIDATVLFQQEAKRWH